MLKSQLIQGFLNILYVDNLVTLYKHSKNKYCDNVKHLCIKLSPEDIMAYYANQNTRQKNMNNQNYPSYDYDYDYNYPQYSQSQNMAYNRNIGQQNKLYNQKTMMKSQGTSGFASRGQPGMSGRQTNNGYPNTEGYSNSAGYPSYGQYSNGYGQPNYDYGYSNGPAAEQKSSYGSYSSSYGKECPGIPIALLLVSLLGVLVMGYILYTKIVGAGRRKRDISDSWSELFLRHDLSFAWRKALS